MNCVTATGLLVLLFTGDGVVPPKSGNKLEGRGVIFVSYNIFLGQWRLIEASKAFNVGTYLPELATYALVRTGANADFISVATRLNPNLSSFYRKCIVHEMRCYDVPYTKYSNAGFLQYATASTQSPSRTCSVIPL